MMRKILNHCYAADFRPHLKPPLYAAEGGQRFDDRLFRDAAARGEGCGRRGVERVVLAGEIHFDPGPQRAFAPDLPAHGFRILAKVPELPLGLRRESVALDACTSARANALGHIFAPVPGHDEAAARHQIHQPLESRLYRIQVRVDVGVVKFNMGEDQGVREVVQESSGPLSKKAVSYSSPSRMKVRVGRNWKLVPKFSATPPIRNDGSRAASCMAAVW